VRARELAGNLLLAVVPLALVLGAAELLVRATGAADTCPNRFSSSAQWVCDPILHFRVDPELRPNGQPLNSLGFRSAEFGPRRPGVYRVLALGDSCTFGYVAREDGIGFVLQPYPLRLQRLVERRIGAGRLEVLNAGMPGYNSYQGLLLLRTRLRGLAPDLVTVRFGWNDHFLSAAGEEELFREPETRVGLALEDLLLRSRLYAFVRRLGLELRALRRPVGDQLQAAFREQTGYRPTIPIERYRHNLRRIVELSRSRGARVWLLTAPRNPDPGPEARRVLAAHNKLPFDRLVRIHDEYNDAVRRVGSELGTLVVDMDRVYRRFAGAPLFLKSDVPHPDQPGHNLEAETLYDVLVARGVVERGRER
jgi:lysophospholipase L1-like esterase